MSSAPVLSVVIPAYNNAATIAETMDSVLSQREVDLELVVADHSSSDGTREQMERFASDPRVRLMDTPAGGGAPRNWNRVTDQARGRLLKLVCGDDVVLPGALARQVAILEDPSVALTASKRDVVDAEGKILMPGWGLRGLSARTSGAETVRRTIRAGSNLLGEPASVMMRRSDLANAGGWLRDYPYLIDQASYSRVLLRGDFVPDPEVGATFRMSTGQWSVALSNDQAAQARGFHEWFRSQHPDIVSAADVRVGNLRATLMSHARRASYWVLKRRMR